MKRVLTFNGILLVIALIACHQEPEIIGTYLAVSSTPQDADVYIDDSLTEYQTNCVIPDIEPGEYTIKLKLYDFPEWSTVVKVEEGETTKVAGIFPINEGTIKWVYPLGDYYYGYQPAIGPDGTVYLYKGDLFALNPDGAVKWTYSAEGGSKWAAIGPDGTIYIEQNEHETAKICALSSSGSLKWEFQIDTIRAVSTAFAIGAEGSVYFIIDNYLFSPPKSWLYSLTYDGALKWKKEITYAGTPAIGADGTIYVGDGGYLYAFDQNGNLKWAYQKGSWLTSPAIGSDGTIYFCSGNYLCALSTNGALKWKYQTNGSTYSPAIGADGTIYVGSTTYDPDEYYPYASSLFAITPSGHLKWSLSLSSDDYISHIESTPTVGADGMVYITHYPLGLCGFDENGNLKWNLDGVRSYSSPAIADDGTLYITGYDGLYAIQTTSFGLADSPWPKYAHDNQNTGRAGAL